MTNATRLLPGETEEDRELISRAIQQIASMHQQASMQFACAVGRFIIEEFFGGDIDQYLQRRHRHSSYRALAKRPELPLSHSGLCQAVGVFVQANQLPTQLSAALTFTHHRALLPVRDPVLKEKLARQALEAELNTRELADLVRRHLRDSTSHVPRGRPRLPAYVKGIRRLADVVDSTISEEIRLPDVARFGTYESEELVEVLAAQLEHLQALHDDLRDAIQQTRARRTASDPRA